MRTLIVIPARFASTRYPGKPLQLVVGHSLIKRMWYIAKAVVDVDAVVVATDDQRIAEHVRAFGGCAVMTDPACQSGTERSFEVARSEKYRPDVIINLQGDAVLTPPAVVQELVRVMKNDATAEISTPIVRLNTEQYLQLIKAKEKSDVSGTFVTFDSNFNALYFSRSPIPYLRDHNAEKHAVYRHIGLYAYRFEALNRYVKLMPSKLEQAEKLEQLRALENGMKIKVVPVDYHGRTHWSIDTPQDAHIVEQIIERQGELVEIV